jgi:hypothetical protein
MHNNAPFDAERSTDDDDSPETDSRTIQGGRRASVQPRAFWHCSPRSAHLVGSILLSQAPSLRIDPPRFVPPTWEGIRQPELLPVLTGHWLSRPAYFYYVINILRG